MRNGFLSFLPGLTVLVIAASILTSCSSVPSSTSQSSSGSTQPTAAKTTPVITWTAPAAITSPTPLGATQLVATANVTGTFVYTPPAGTVLAAGTQTLSVAFTPTNTASYNNATASVSITVDAASTTPPATTPTITWAAPAAITSSTALSSTQLDATANVVGTFVYNPPAGTVLTAGTHTLSVTFTPTNAAAYTTANATVPITVNAAPVEPAFLVSIEATSGNTSNSYTNFVDYKFDATSGTLAATSTVPTGSAAPASMALHPNHQWIYTAAGQCCPEAQFPFVQAFSLDSATGALSPIPGSPFYAGTFSNTVVVHPSGKFLYYDNYYTQSPGSKPGLSGYSLGSNGAPTALSGSPFAGYVGASGMAFSPDGKFLFTVPQQTQPQGGSQVYTFSVDTNTGAVSQIGVTTVSPSTTYFAAINAVQVAPAGNYVYVASDSTIAAFSLNAQTGQLTPVSGSPFAVVSYLSSFAMSPDGRFLYAAECIPPSEVGLACDGALKTLAVNSNGQISSVGSLPLAPSYGLPGVTASGSFVFAGTITTHTVQGGSQDIYTGTINTFSADPSTGVLTPAGTTTTAGGAGYLLAVPAP
jgi:6-phosphogluconolactonase (cycloisomerase 2 family)